MVLRALILSSTMLFSGLSEAAPKSVKNLHKPTRIVLFHANNTVSIEEIDATSIRVEPQSRGDSPNQGLEADGKKIVLQRGVVTTSGVQEKRFEVREPFTKAILWSEDVPVVVQSYWPQNLASLLKAQWLGLQQLAWVSQYSAGSFSTHDKLLFNRPAKTLDKTVDDGTWENRMKFKMRFLGVTSEMLDAVSREKLVRDPETGGVWGQEFYLPKYGASVEVLQFSAGLDSSNELPVEWNEWKAKVIWRVPRPKLP